MVYEWQFSVFQRVYFSLVFFGLDLPPFLSLEIVTIMVKMTGKLWQKSCGRRTGGSREWCIVAE